MASASWETLQPLLLLLAPLLLPKALSFYRSLRSSPSSSTTLPIQPVQPVPPRARLALALLFLLAATHLVQTVPALAPENIFLLTSTRLQTPAPLLFARLAALRPGQSLTPTDTSLRAKLANLDSRLLYAQYGPRVLADCPFCAADEPTTYLWYALPSLLATHAANLVGLAVATSRPLAGKSGAQWRRMATLTALCAALLDGYLVSAFDHRVNAAARPLADVRFFYWSARNRRLLALCLLDAALGLLMYLSATNRAFAVARAPAGRIRKVTSRLAAARSRLGAAAIIANAGMRTEELRGRCAEYWAREAAVMRAVMEERAVIEGVNDALSNRIDIEAVEREAGTYTEGVMGAFFAEGEPSCDGGPGTGE